MANNVHLQNIWNPEMYIHDKEIAPEHLDKQLVLKKTWKPSPLITYRNYV